MFNAYTYMQRALYGSFFFIYHPEVSNKEEIPVF